MTRSLAEFAVSISTDGAVVAQGTVQEVLGADEPISKIVEEDKEMMEMAAEEVDKPAAPITDGKLIVGEELEEGHVSWKAGMLDLTSKTRTTMLIWWQ
jgi:hypothetical protein